jgi:uncharacterized membrane protein YgcG
MPQTHAVTAGDVGHAELLFPTTKRCIYRMRVVPAVTAAYSGRISDFRAGSAQRSCFSSGLLSSTIKPDTFCEKPDLLNASRVGKTVQRRFTSLTSRGHVSEFPKLLIVQRALTSLLVFVLSFAAYPQSVDAQDQPGPSEARPAPQYTQQTPEELQRLVAPIALYPDSLVAQILGASTFPEQLVDADRWVQAHPDVRGAALAQAVDQLPWDPSVKALVAFPSVLGNMDKNLSWTSSLGDAYYNQEQDVIDAVQVMRRRAQEAGHLNSTPQQTVTTQSSEIVIEPVSPEIVYVPAYDPWIVYGEPVAAWGGWYPYPGIWVDGPVIAFGVGFGVGYFGDYGWGWHHWGCDWHHHYAVHDHGRYYSTSRTFYNRDKFYRGEATRGMYNRPERAPEPFAGSHGAARGYAEPRGQSEAHFGAFDADRGTARRDAEPRGRSDARFGAVGGESLASHGNFEARTESGVRSGAFSGYGSGGDERSFSSRGSASFGRGGGSHGGGRH